MSLVKRLLEQGDEVAIHNGRIVIIPASGKSVPSDWFKQKSIRLIGEIAETSGLNVFVYECHSTGYYGKHKSSGVTLHYRNVITGDAAYLIFNADLVRARATKHGKKGGVLPKGQFRVRERSAFTYYWQVTLGLEKPRRLSGFHECMGKLGAVFIVGNYAKNNTIDKSSVKLLELSGLQIEWLFGIGQSSDKRPTIHGQAPDNLPTRVADSKIAESYVVQGVQRELTACADGCVLSNKVRANKGSNTVPSMRPIDQTINEWLADYGCD